MEDEFLGPRMKPKRASILNQTLHCHFPRFFVSTTENAISIYWRSSNTQLLVTIFFGLTERSLSLLSRRLFFDEISPGGFHRRSVSLAPGIWCTPILHTEKNNLDQAKFSAKEVTKSNMLFETLKTSFFLIATHHHHHHQKVYYRIEQKIWVPDLFVWGQLKKKGLRKRVACRKGVEKRRKKMRAVELSRPRILRFKYSCCKAILVKWHWAVFKWVSWNHK